MGMIGVRTRRQLITLPACAIGEYGKELGATGVAVLYALTWKAETPRDARSVAELLDMDRRLIDLEIANLIEYGFLEYSDEEEDGPTLLLTYPPPPIRDDVQGDRWEAEEYPPSEPIPYTPNPIHKKLAERDGTWCCHYCWTPLASSQEDIDNGLPIPQKDHKQPRSRGGRNTLENLVLACPACNRQKWNRYTYDEFMVRTAPLRRQRLGGDDE